MTANALQGDKEKCLNAGMNDYISKPIDLEEFLEKIEIWAKKKLKPAGVEDGIFLTHLYFCAP